MNISIKLVLAFAACVAALDGPSNVLVPMGSEAIMACGSNNTEVPCGNITWTYRAMNGPWIDAIRNNIVDSRLRNFVFVTDNQNGRCDLWIKTSIFVSGLYRCTDEVTGESSTAGLGVWEPLTGEAQYKETEVLIYCASIYGGPWCPLITGRGQDPQIGFMTCSSHTVALIKISFRPLTPLTISCNMSYNAAVWPPEIDVPGLPCVPDSNIEISVRALPAPVIPAPDLVITTTQSIFTTPDNIIKPIFAPPLSVVERHQTPIGVAPVVLGIILFICVTGFYCNYKKKTKEATMPLNHPVAPINYTLTI